MGFEILPASLRDLSAFHKLEHACFKKDAWSLFDLVAVLTFPDVVRLKVVQDSRMVGFIAGDPRQSQGFSWIATLGVLPEYRRQGIAKALLQACESRLHSPRIRLCVRMSNESAIGLYHHAGYQTIDVWRKYYNNGEDAMIMEKEHKQMDYNRGHES